MRVIKKIFTAKNFFIAAVAAFSAALVYLLLLRFVPHLDEHYNVITRVDYEFLPLFTFLGLITLFWPMLFNKLSKYKISGFLLCFYVGFTVAALLLGTVFDFYVLVPHWDTMLHFFSGVGLAVLGFAIMDIVERNQNTKYPRLLIVIFAFCFAKTLGIIWEISEFFMDIGLGTNTQQWADRYGVPLVGQDALFDTMKDIIANTIGAVIVCVWAYFRLHKKDWPKVLSIMRTR